MLLDQALLLQVIADNFPGGISVMDRDLRVIFTTRAARRILDLPDSIFAKGPPQLEEIFRFNASRGEYGTGDVEKVVAARIALAKTFRPHEFERQRPDGTILEIRGVPIEGSGFITTYMDITERRRSEARIEHMAHHDALTGLPNRVMFDKRLGESLERIAGSGGNLAVIFIDLDRFKNVNDTLGHPIGDLLLKTVAEPMSNCLRNTDILARLGGDEFAIIIPAIDGVQGAEMLAEKLIDVLCSAYELEGHTINVGASIGIALAPADGHTSGRLLKSADLALYKAKADGRNRIRYHLAEMDTELQARLKLEMIIRDAVLHHRFELHYQPIFEISGRRLIGFEALIRLPAEDGTLISPLVFIPLAEDLRLIDKIGAWVLREACRTATNWPEHLTVAVNLSPAQFLAGSVSEIVAAALKEAALAAHRLELEITETLLLGNTNAIMSELQTLKSMGVAIVMDDFGTGYSSLSYLWRFPFDKIKIDRSLMQEFECSGRDVKTVVKTIIALGRELNMRVTVEGVETTKQMAFLDQAEGDQAQGFFFGRPVPASEVGANILADFQQQQARALEGRDRDQIAAG
jgi:diguanylate cyclase (GGDEF)-like protein